MHTHPYSSSAIMDGESEDVVVDEVGAVAGFDEEGLREAVRLVFVCLLVHGGDD